MALPLIPLAVLGLGLGLVACAKVATAPKPDSPLYDLAGSEWGPEDGQGQFIQFRAKGELSGSGGCNNFFGSYDLNGTQLTIGPLASTKKFCVEGMDAEREFLSALQNARNIDATHLTLNIYDQQGVLLLSLKRRDWD